jgi:hypothetical protein
MGLLFQYGSNMSSYTNQRLQGKAVPVGLAITCEQYELDFTHFSTDHRNQCATADLIPGGGRHIHGVLYEIPVAWIFRLVNKTEKPLDAWEGEIVSENDH